jgi:hypothetical protein
LVEEHKPQTEEVIPYDFLVALLGEFSDEKDGCRLLFAISPNIMLY